MKKILMGFLALSLATTASAHTGMLESPLLHNAIHMLTATSIYLAIIALGLYLFRKLPKAKKQHIKTDRK